MNEINTTGYLQFSVSPPQEIFSGGGDYFHSNAKCHQNPRKKRTKLIRIDDPIECNSSSPSPSTTSGVAVKKPKYGAKKPDPSAPKITRPCTECGKKFWSWKALFGHMRCHPERQWRGINPPPNFRRPEENDDVIVETEWTQEDHEVAACLLMLANSPSAFETKGLNLITLSAVNHGVLECDSLVFRDTAAAHGGGGSSGNGDSVFECSSCKKVFGSHQALGGHRATHKNVKGCFAITRSDGDQEVVPGDYNNGDDHVDCNRSGELVEGMGLGGHKCSICSRVFASGQALGGHKRCHWEKGDHEDHEPSLSLVTQGLNFNNPFGGSRRESCGLDLNLPAPVELNSSSSLSSPGLTLDLRLGL